MSQLATYIRDQAYNRLTSGNIAVNWKSQRKIPLPTLQSEQLPALAVYVQSETMNPDGDDNVSVPSYIVDAVLSISVFDSAEKPEVLAGALDPLVDLIEDTLLQDITFVSLKDANGTFVIESFPQIRRSYSYPQAGESYYMEARLSLTVRFRAQFIPVTPTPLTDVMVDVQPFDQTVQSPNYVSDIVLPQ